VFDSLTVLQVFHHRNPTQKRFTISAAVAAGLRIATILEEIEKCSVLCANCHAKQHHSKTVAVSTTGMLSETVTLV